jgi:hypothetical protein
VKEIALKDAPVKINWKVDAVSNTFVKMTIGNGQETLLKHGD